MRVKKLLKQCRSEKREILILTQKRDMIRMSLLPKSLNIKPDTIQSSPDPDTIGEKISIADELEKEISLQLETMMQHELEAHKLVWKLDDSRCRQVLELYYLSYKEDAQGNKDLYAWEDVADEMGYAISTVFDFVDKAWEALKHA